jgi:hypothetical protein
VSTVGDGQKGNWLPNRFLVWFIVALYAFYSL